MKNAKVIGLICALTLVAAVPALAKDKKDKKNEGKNDKNEKVELEIKAPVKVEVKAPAPTPSKQPALKVSISTSERETIQKYCSQDSGDKKGKKGKSLPPGLEKKAARGDLPPGWEKKLMVGQPMPVDVLKECKPLPKDLVVKLPSPPKGVITVAIDGKIVRLMEATREILDVFDVLPH